MILKRMRWPEDAERIRRGFLEVRSFAAWSGRRNLVRAVEEICERVGREGDPALLDYVRRFDKVDLKAPSELLVKDDEIREASGSVPGELADALRAAADRIESFHRRQLEQVKPWEEAADGNVRGELLHPVERVGVYVPGGRARYPSSLLMGAIPARVAGVGGTVVATPPGPGGVVAPEVLLAASLAGVRRVYKMGGAHAVAALAFGTETVENGKGVDMIVGAGGPYVTAAKQVLYGTVGIDSLAGPSELMVLADSTADARAVAWDMMGQAEHGEDSCCILVTDAAGFVERVEREMEAALDGLKRRTTILRCLSGTGSGAILAGKLTGELVKAVVNVRAPEHLELVVEKPEELLGSVERAGCVLVGTYSPCALGDYASGANHVIPTAGCARFASPLGVSDFVVRSSYLRWSKPGLAAAGATIKSLGMAEGLEAHAGAPASRGL